MNGMEQGKAFFDKAKKLFSEKKSGVLLCFGIAGIGLIFLSSVIKPESKLNPPTGAGQNAMSAQEYAQELEGRLTSIIGKIDGVGKCEVLVTTETGVEYVYAVEESRNVNETNSFDGQQVQRQTQQQNSEQKYIVVDAGGGKKEALLKTEKRPKVQGVVVVCEGAGSTVVQQRVSEVVTTALDIPYTKVCVTKIGKH